MKYSRKSLMIWAINAVPLAACLLLWTTKNSYWEVLPMVVRSAGTLLIIWLLGRIARFWDRDEPSAEKKECRRLKFRLRSLLLVMLAVPPLLALLFFSRQYWSLEMIPTVIFCAGFMAACYFLIDPPDMKSLSYVIGWFDFAKRSGRKTSTVASSRASSVPS